MAGAVFGVIAWPMRAAAWRAIAEDVGRGRSHRACFLGDAHGGQLLRDEIIIIVVGVISVRMLVLVVIGRALSPMIAVAGHFARVFARPPRRGCWGSRFGMMVPSVLASTTASHNPREFRA